MLAVTPSDNGLTASEEDTEQGYELRGAMSMAIAWTVSEHVSAARGIDGLGELEGTDL